MMSQDVAMWMFMMFDVLREAVRLRCSLNDSEHPEYQKTRVRACDVA